MGIEDYLDIDDIFEYKIFNFPKRSSRKDEVVSIEENISNFLDEYGKIYQYYDVKDLLECIKRYYYHIYDDDRICCTLNDNESIFSIKSDKHLTTFKDEVFSDLLEYPSYVSIKNNHSKIGLDPSGYITHLEGLSKIMWVSDIEQTKTFIGIHINDFIDILSTREALPGYANSLREFLKTIDIKKEFLKDLKCVILYELIKDGAFGPRRALLYMRDNMILSDIPLVYGVSEKDRFLKLFLSDYINYMTYYGREDLINRDCYINYFKDKEKSKIASSMEVFDSVFTNTEKQKLKLVIR